MSPDATTETGSPNEAELAELFERLSNWGRWGQDDERGTLNFVTARAVVDACRTVRSGRVVSVSHDLDTVRSPKNTNPVVLELLDPGDMSLTDNLQVVAHSLTVTHVDALAHCFYEDRVYGGRKVQDVLGDSGVSFGSVMALAAGVVTTGVLLDVAEARGVDYLTVDETVTVDDLCAAERLAGRRVQSGDAVLVRVGLAEREAVEGPEDGEHRAGLATNCLEWIHDREVSVFGGDCFDALPAAHGGPSHPLHAVGIAAMGLVMVDNVAVEPLRAACREEGRSTFAFLTAPLRVPGGTGSPVNPLCVF